MSTEMIRIPKMNDSDRELVNVLSADERLIALREAGRRKVAAMNERYNGLTIERAIAAQNDEMVAARNVPGQELVVYADENEDTGDWMMYFCNGAMPPHSRERFGTLPELIAWARNHGFGDGWAMQERE